MTHDSYFMILVKVFTNHILVENIYFANHIEWAKHKIMVLKRANKYQIIWQDDKYKKFLLTVTSFSYFFLKQKFIKHHFLWSQK